MFAIIGCSHAHIGDFIQEMLALGHPCAGIYESGDRSLAGQLAERFKVPLADALEDVLSPSVTIVGSSAINCDKMDIVALCERHGKHVMLDKPLVTSRAGLEQLEQIMKRGKIQIGLLLTERFRPSVHTAKQLIAEGTLGDIVHIGIRKPHRLSPSIRPAWHFDSRLSGGIVIDLMIHDFDLLRWLTGQVPVEIESIKSKTILPEHPAFYDVASAQVRLSQGTIAHLYADWHAPDKCWSFGDCRLFISGTKGSLEVRLCGDPAVELGELLFLVTEDAPFRRVELRSLPLTITQDFLMRVDGNESIITHDDIYMASRDTIMADEAANNRQVGTRQSADSPP